MAVEHKNLTDPELHEVKGASTAVADTLLVADGAGSHVWARNLLSDHASMAITNNATATATTAAADATLNTDSDYVKVTAGWAATHESGISFSTDKLQAAIAGDYIIQFWASLKIPSINNFVGIKYAVNDTTPYSAQKIVSQSATSNDYRNLMGSAIVSLAANDTVSIYVASSKTDNIVFEEAGLSMYLVHQ